MTISKGALLRAACLAAAVSVAAPGAAFPIVGDTFNVSLVGQYFGGSQELFNVSATLGGTQTFAGVGREGQDITVASTIAAEGGNTRMTFTVSTLTSFMLTANAGLPAPVVGYLLTIGGGDTVDFTTMPNYLGANGGWNGDNQYSAQTNIVGTALNGAIAYTTNSYSVPASQNNINVGTYSVLVAGAPAAVPEPAMLGLFGLGAVGLGMIRRRKA